MFTFLGFVLGVILLFLGIKEYFIETPPVRSER